MVTEETCMASSETRHAAAQIERRFAVRLLPEGGPPTDLADGLTEFLDAFDLAFDWLNREDPARTGGATLAILETSDGVSEEVWTYPPLPSNGQELTARLGFNPANWAGVPGYSSGERKSRLRERVGATDPRADADEAPWQQIERAVKAEAAPRVEPRFVEPVVAPEPSREPEPAPAPRPAPVERHTPRVDTPRVEPAEPAAAYVTARKWIVTNVRTAWDDWPSRICLVLSGASLWFTLGLADPSVLAPLLVCVPILWWRRRNREALPPETETEDWL
jgi:hypothetical protein